MKSNSQMNEGAAQTIALQWLRSANQIIADGRNPAKLSDWNRMDAQQWLTEFDYKGNSKWYLSDDRWEQKVKPMAVAFAKNFVKTLPEQYPLVVAHFAVKKAA